MDFYADAVCTGTPVVSLSIAGCTDMTNELVDIADALGWEFGTPYAGVNVSCTRAGLVNFTLAWSILEGYGDVCSLDSEIVQLPQFKSTGCAGVSLEGYFGFSVGVKCGAANEGLRDSILKAGASRASTFKGPVKQHSTGVHVTDPKVKRNGHAYGAE